ncbi:acyl-CoA dehydrogenase family protein [Myxococcota bacterium]|nr:acyl-CoA dehydrogenase family protein [Myxococcota bacterium]
MKAFLDESWSSPEMRETSSEPEERVQAFRRAAIERGYLYRSIPRAYGGAEQAADGLAAQVIREEFQKAGAPMEAPGVGTMMLVPTLLEKGEQWQKLQFIPPTLTGQMVWCQGYSEPGSGSDLASLSTRAELVDGEWVIRGQKIWTSSAHVADYMFCLARTEPDATKHAGISYLLIDMKQPGIEIRPLRQMSGQSHFNEVFFDGARTPEHFIVGRRGEGWSVSRATLKHERNAIGGSAQTHALFDAVVELAREVGVEGESALKNPEIRQRLIAIEGYVKAHRYSSYWQHSRESRQQSAGSIPLLNKIVTSNIGHDVARLALDLLEDGGLSEPRISLYARPKPRAEDWIFQYLQSLGVAIAGGTANVQRNIVAERHLGLPRDSAASRRKGSSTA